MKNELARKIILNFRFDYNFLITLNLGFLAKINYLFNKYICILFNKREIYYLGYKFLYDNRFVPVILETYPKEIMDIDKIIELRNIKNILDIGANIGQFAYTIKRFFPNTNIYSFEPNKNIFHLLRKNLQYFKQSKIYNFGLGAKNGKRIFYFSPVASTEGSFYKENMNQNYQRSDVKSINVDIINLNKKTLSKLHLPIKYDLIKIDVEGAEIEVLKSLKMLKTKYLLIEVSVKRKSEGNLEDVKRLIKEIWNVEPKLVYYNLPDKNSPAATAIFDLID